MRNFQARKGGGVAHETKPSAPIVSDDRPEERRLSSTTVCTSDEHATLEQWPTPERAVEGAVADETESV